MHGGVGGENPRGFPLSRLPWLYRPPLTSRAVLRVAMRSAHIVEPRRRELGIIPIAVRLHLCIARRGGCELRLAIGVLLRQSGGSNLRVAIGVLLRHSRGRENSLAGGKTHDGDGC